MTKNRAERKIRRQYERPDLMVWTTTGQYEYEYSRISGYTGWYRCVGGRLADGRWPEWNHKNSKKRYSGEKHA